MAIGASIFCMARPTVVYHYTTAETLLKILDSQSIWASNLRYLNDVSESEHCIRMMRNRLPDFLAKYKPVCGEDLELALAKLKVSASNAPYVASFSTHRDSLPQWRSYCRDGNGVSIGFRASALRRSTLSDEKAFGRIPPGTSRLEEVQYLSDADWKKTDKLILSCIKELDKWHRRQDSLDPDERNEIADDSVLQYAIMRIACVVKHASFLSEREHRLIAPDGYFAGKNVMNFRSSKTTVIPYMNVRMPKWGESRKGPPKFSPTFDDFYLEEVVVGPTPNPDLTVDALGSLFFGKRVPVVVRKSNVPYRDL
jgi:hypothetical protein